MPGADGAICSGTDRRLLLGGRYDTDRGQIRTRIVIPHVSGDVADVLGRRHLPIRLGPIAQPLAPRPLWRDRSPRRPAHGDSFAPLAEDRLGAGESTGGGQRVTSDTPGDRCLLYYNQPRRCPNYLALKYVVSRVAIARFATFRKAAQTLDEVARIKQTDAILCDAWNLRISDRLFARWGWEPHKPQRWHRNFIKRFYGVYPQSAQKSTRTQLLAAQ